MAGGSIGGGAGAIMPEYPAQSIYNPPITHTELKSNPVVVHNVFFSRVDVGDTYFQITPPTNQRPTTNIR
jgi:hypothetical protein